MRAFLIILFFLSIILEPVYEGLERKSQLTLKNIYSTIGHLIQVIWIFCLVLLGMYISIMFCIHAKEYWITILICYPIIRFALFNPVYNLVAGNELTYAGEIDICDKLENYFLRITLMPAHFLLWIRLCVFVCGTMYLIFDM